MKAIFAFVLLLAHLSMYAQQTKKPNIIIILADDLGWGDVGFHGSDIKTPNIDKLAKEGTVLDHFYTAPICSPTRAGMMTGRYPNRFGLRFNVIPPWSHFGVDTAEEFIPQMLQQAGYANRAAIGKWHLGHASRKFLPLQRGFTHFYGHYNGALDYFTHKRQGELDWHNDEASSYDTGYTTDLITKEAVKCIRNYAKQSPFFIYVAFNAPHAPLQAKKEDLLTYGYDPSKPSFTGAAGDGEVDGETGKGNTARQTYSAMVTAMDKGVGQILQTLKDMHIEDNTLVLFYSDNGTANTEYGSSGELHGMKFQEWEGGVRSAAILKWPAAVKGGKTIEQVMGYVDIAPTLREIAGVKTQPAKPYDGISMLPVLTGQKKQIDRTFYLGYGSLISNQWKIVKANTGNPRMKHAEDLLFNIMTDPSEKKNVKDANPDVFKKLDAIVTSFDAIKPSSSVPPFGEGRKGFVAPKEWKIAE